MAVSQKDPNSRRAYSEAKLFSFRYQGTKTLRKNNKILGVFMGWWQILLGSDLAGLGY